MDSTARRQIGLVLRDAVKDFQTALNEQLNSIYSDHSAKGRLQSGATVQVAIRKMEEMALEATEQMAGKVLEISRDKDAFGDFREAVCDLIEFFRDELSEVVRMASGRLPCEPSPSIEAAARALFDEMESKIERKIEIEEFKFRGPEVPDTVPAPALEAAKTGRPRSSFWDEMWASIARDLYEGDLKPRTQADIETAMLRWIEDHGHSAAVSTVRSRARRLWDLICAR